MAEEGYEDPTRPFTISYIAGDHASVFHFRDHEEGHDWYEGLNDIKNSIAFFNQCASCPQPWLSAHQETWLPMVCALSQKWGPDRALEDIKRLCDKVEAELQAENKQRPQDDLAPSLETTSRHP